MTSPVFVERAVMAPDVPKVDPDRPNLGYFRVDRYMVASKKPI
jgi:hypothetical protein